MEQDKRMVKGYEVVQVIEIGKVEVILAVAEQQDKPYLVCYCTRQNPLSMEQYYGAESGNDYLKAMQDFTGRIQDEVASLQQERAELPLDMPVLTANECHALTSEANIENELLAIRPERLRPEYRAAHHQLVVAIGGFGMSPHARGRAVYVRNVYSGKEQRWNRDDMLGSVKLEHIPPWAHQRIEQQQASEKKRANQRSDAR
ncbi:hypothetical protein PPYC1_20125 [Paenibacillus polymyxa]|uniref:hypothetical protein n=1 Tax=Paenibacillus polymyxa TaxID=1406 RepID=UPI0008FC2425|nr:hypothetical protein [Paenibacillus polymyxa]APB72538.1 hypothetical protein PPYC1_20125 [Paenibacillus polymyxa]